MSDDTSGVGYQVLWCDDCAGRVGFDVDCADVEHSHRWVRCRRRPLTSPPPSSMSSMSPVVVDDGSLGLEGCVRPDCTWTSVVAKPDRCRGERDGLGCPRDVHDLVDRLYRELERLVVAGDGLAAGVRTGRWDEPLDRWDEVRRRWAADGGDGLDDESAAGMSKGEGVGVLPSS